MIGSALQLLEFALRAMIVSGSIAAAAALGLQFLRHRPARQRVGLLRAAILLCFFALVAAWPGWYEPLPLQVDTIAQRLADGRVVEHTTSSHYLLPASLVLAGALLLVVGWGLGLTRVAVGLLQTQRLLAAAKPTKDAGVYASDRVTLPATVGLLSPVILLPVAAFRRGGLDAVLTHERAHVEAHDPLWLTLAATLRALLFFHPAAHWLGRRLELEQELAADECVVRAGHPARGYAHELLDWAAASTSMPAFALAAKASPTQLERRLRWILRARRAGSSRAALGSAMLLLVLALASIRLGIPAFAVDAPGAAQFETTTQEVER